MFTIIFSPLTLFALLLVLFLLHLIAIIDIARNQFPRKNKLIWILYVIFFPVVGTILYFVIGTKQKLKRNKK